MKTDDRTDTKPAPSGPTRQHHTMAVDQSLTPAPSHEDLVNTAPQKSGTPRLHEPGRH